MPTEFMLTNLSPRRFYTFPYPPWLPKFPKFVMDGLAEFPREILLVTPLGSKLHGTAVEGSDNDFAVVYLPSLLDVYLQVRPPIDGPLRFNEDGSPVLERRSVQGAGYELKPVSITKLIEGYLSGSPESIETLSSIRANFMALGTCPKSWIDDRSKLGILLNFLKDFAESVKTVDVRGIMSFAWKNYDFLQSKNKRLATYLKLKELIDEQLQADPSLKLVLLAGRDGHFLKVLTSTTRPGLEGVRIDYDSNGDSRLGRVVLFEKPVSKRWTWDDLLRHIESKIDQYGDRTKLAHESGFDAKGFSHAVRCCLETADILKQGYITFPLKQADLVKEFKSAKTLTPELRDKLTDALKYSANLIGSIPDYPGKVQSSKGEAEEFLKARLPGLFRLLHLEST